jgi:hypothetical protein
MSKLADYSSVNMTKAHNGVIVRPDDRCNGVYANDSVLVFNTFEQFSKWAREFFPTEGKRSRE